MKGKFKKEFVKLLKEKIPPKILDLDLKFPEKQNGFIRLENFKLTAVYLSRLSSNTPDANGDRMLKFQYRDFHYVEPSYIFKNIYIANGNDECRYDSEMKLDSKYALGQNLSIKDGEIKNGGYKTELLGKKVKMPYHVVISKPVPSLSNFSNKTMQQINEITDDYDINNTWWQYRGDCKPDKIMYLCIGS